jgi:hypothetical protein
MEKLKRNKKSYRLYDIKKMFFIGLLSLVYVSALSQAVFYPVKKGMQLEYTTLNAQKKVQSYTSMKVKDVSGTTDNKMVKVVIQTLNAQKNPTSESMAFDVNIKGGKIILDPKLMFAPYLQANMKITGKPNSIPATLSTGQTWPDVEVVLSISFASSVMQTKVKLTQRKVLAKETIKVLAGTYICYKTTHTVIITPPIGNQIKETHIMWFAEGIGHVKTEKYDDKNKLQSIEELSSVKA